MDATIFIHWFHFFFVGRPWYVAAIWGNVFVVVVVAPLGWVWSKTKYWPLHPLNEATVALHAKIDAHIERFEAERKRSREHDEWQHRAMCALKRGDDIPQHPDFDSDLATKAPEIPSKP